MDGWIRSVVCEDSVHTSSSVVVQGDFFLVLTPVDYKQIAALGTSVLASILSQFE